MRSTAEIDVVYVVGGGSAWYDNELRYSLRSVEKYLQGYREVHIVGHKPSFLNNEVNHIPHKDLYTNPARNIMEKILHATREKKVTQNFMLFNDDYFLLKTTQAKGYPYYYKCDLEHTVTRNVGNDYFPHVVETLALLKNSGLPTLNFDTHKPILYNKKRFREIVHKYNWNRPHGYIMKSLYCNSLGIVGVPELDCKINHPHITESWRKILAGKEMFSIGDRAINRSLTSLLAELYPEPCKYEAWPSKLN